MAEDTDDPTVEHEEGVSTELASDESQEDAEDQPEVNYQVEELGPCYMKLTIQVAQNESKQSLEEAYSELRQDAMVPGFRRGRTPRWLLEKRFGKQVKEDIQSKMMQAGLKHALEDSDLSPIGTPELDEEAIEFDPEKDFEFEVRIYTRPSFELKDYLGLEIEIPEFKVTDEIIERSVKDILRSKSKLIDAPDGAEAEMDDLVVADVRLVRDGAEIWSENELNLLLSERTRDMIMVPELIDIALGAKIGDSKTETITISDTFSQEEHRGQEGELTIDVKKHQNREYPELTDEIAQELGYDSADDVEDKIRVSFDEQNQRILDAVTDSSIVNKLVETAEIDLPEPLIEKHTETRVEKRRVELEAKSVTDEEMKKEIDAFRETSRDGLIREMKQTFIMQYIAENEGIELEEEEVDERLGTMAEEMREDPFDLRDRYEEDGTLDVLRDRMLQEKTMELVKKHAVVTTKSPEKEESDSEEEATEGSEQVDSSEETS
tara:strand:+ start:883 stop:2358 length:1476 start_codon:yes stop_codon:yes gene_type:complete